MLPFAFSDYSFFSNNINFPDRKEISVVTLKELDGKEGNVAASQGALKDVIQVAEIPTLALDQRCELYDETYR